MFKPDPSYVEQYKDAEAVETFTGKMFSVVKPRLEDINVLDIAHALSLKCRYNGHTKKFYSVAEHCARLSNLARIKGRPVAEQLHLLMHDGAEAYLPDVPRPIKHLFPDLVAMEKGLDSMVRQRFGLSDVVPPIVKDWDSRIIRDERAHLMNKTSNPWQVDGLEPLGVDLDGWDPGRAEYVFLYIYNTVAAEYFGRLALMVYSYGGFSDGGGTDIGRRAPNYKTIDLIGGVAQLHPDENGETRFEHGNFQVLLDNIFFPSAPLGAPAA